ARAHHPVVVPAKDRAADGGERVHPPLGGGDVPLVQDRGQPLVLEEAPAAGALELTGRGALEQAGRLDARGLDLELDGVGDRAAPDVAAALADAALVA